MTTKELKRVFSLGTELLNLCHAAGIPDVREHTAAIARAALQKYHEQFDPANIARLLTQVSTPTMEATAARRKVCKPLERR
jgi:hypothetical protein